MKTILYFLSAALFFVSCSINKQSGSKTSEEENSLLWEVTGNGITKPSYLFGTFHLLCKEDIHFSDELKNAIQQCDTIYMEMDMDDPAMALNMMKFMSMVNDTTLKDLYTPEEYQRIEKYFKDSLQTPIAFMQKMKPYLLVSLLYPRMMDCTVPTGVEQELILLAKQENKPINGLETLEFQASIFDKIPYQWQAKELLKAIDSLDKGKAEFKKMINLYKNQQLDSLSKMISDSEFNDDMYGAILLTERNKNWAKKLDSLLKHESVFVAVGAGHLPGKEGLINLLRDLGYTVTALKNK